MKIKRYCIFDFERFIWKALQIRNGNIQMKFHILHSCAIVRIVAYWVTITKYDILDVPTCKVIIVLCVVSGMGRCTYITIISTIQYDKLSNGIRPRCTSVRDFWESTDVVGGIICSGSLLWFRLNAKEPGIRNGLIARVLNEITVLFKGSNFHSIRRKSFSSSSNWIQRESHAAFCDGWSRTVEKIVQDFHHCCSEGRDLIFS